MDWYQGLKDFAGPVATICASGAASYVAWQLTSRQVAIANEQANTALDQLRVALFDRRYRVYDDVRTGLRTLLNLRHDKEFLTDNMLLVINATKEARFFFPTSLCDWLDRVWEDEVVSYVAARQKPAEPVFLKAHTDLLARWNELPDRFQTEMRFSQLTRSARRQKSVWVRTNSAATPT